VRDAPAAPQSASSVLLLRRRSQVRRRCVASAFPAALEFLGSMRESMSAISLDPPAGNRSCCGHASPLRQRRSPPNTATNLCIAVIAAIGTPQSVTEPAPPVNQYETRTSITAKFAEKPAQSKNGGIIHRANAKQPLAQIRLISPPASLSIRVARMVNP
jgi:hypothetical protein